jgi:hypothetical protein
VGIAPQDDQIDQQLLRQIERDTDSTRAEQRWYWATYWENFRKTHSEWQVKAQPKWGSKAVSIVGDGPFALLTWCVGSRQMRGSEVTVSLWATRDDAEGQKRFIDESARGGVCGGAHEVLDLRSLPRRADLSPLGRVLRPRRAGDGSLF